MIDKKNISLENILSAKKQNFLYRISPRILKNIYDKYELMYLQNKYSYNADHREILWDWKSIQYNRIALVNLLLSKYENPKYLEIGCASNSLFDSVFAYDKVGIDPANGGTMRKTSDEFFKKNRTKFDVVFIDGLHTYEQVRKDINNALRFLNLNKKSGSWICLHDMLPGNWKEQHVPILTKGTWTGDVWKVAFELSQTQGVEFKIVKIDHGVGVIKVTKKNIKLKDLTETMTNKQFPYYFDSLKKLPVTNWENSQKWLLG
jgi:hypothetical protein